MDDSKEQKAEQSTVTRPKHPGRVAQGKKLAAMMKERKDALLKNRDSEVGKNRNSEVVSELSSAADTAAGDHIWQYSGLGVILLIAGIGVYFYIGSAKSTRKTSVALSAEPVIALKKWME